jgi:hypothetical protein
MLLPNKITSFNESVISKFAKILRILEQSPVAVHELYRAVKSGTNDIEDFLITLDCLYALGKVDFNEERSVIYYVSNVG